MNRPWFVSPLYDFRLRRYPCQLEVSRPLRRPSRESILLLSHFRQNSPKNRVPLGELPEIGMRNFTSIGETEAMAIISCASNKPCGVPGSLLVVRGWPRGNNSFACLETPPPAPYASPGPKRPTKSFSYIQERKSSTTSFLQPAKPCGGGAPPHAPRAAEKPRAAAPSMPDERPSPGATTYSSTRSAIGARSM
jgi:hypothetical protein